MPVVVKILFLAAEAEPFIKVGGLADVAGSLPIALRSLPSTTNSIYELDVRLVLPFHKKVHASFDPVPLAEFEVHRNGIEIPARVFESSLAGMPVYLIDGRFISEANAVYSSDTAQDREKYAFFSLAALEMINQLDWKPHILHANDWHTSMALYALRGLRSETSNERIHTILTIHNLTFTGGDCSDVLDAYGLAPVPESVLPEWASHQPLSLGLLSADAIVAVSPTYAREILTPELGNGFETYLQTRASDITGILNGIDTHLWDPETDASLAVQFSRGNLEGRTKNKTLLQHQFSLDEDPRLPVLAMIGRLDRQKGIEIAIDALRLLSDCRWQLIILGLGDPALKKKILTLQDEFPGRICVITRFDTPLSRRIYGSADLFLMPSLYEPCGLAQMIAMRYGCIPVVRATGGLKDTVHENRTGFLFSDPDPICMSEALLRALSAYSDVQTWQAIQQNAMLEDFSWSSSALQYAQIYCSLISPQ